MNMKILALLMALLMALSMTAMAETVEENALENELELVEEPEEVKTWWNILLLGGDSRSTEDSGRTDTMIILSVNKEETIIKMTSIMRDTWVEFPGLGFSGKINAANVYGGPELAVKTVNNCFGTDIEDYVVVNMADMVSMIDMIGGIELDVTESERKYINDYAADYINSVEAYEGETTLEQSGLVHLNGLLATAHMRNRYTDNDYGRVMRQQDVLLAMATKMQDMEINDLMEQADIYLQSIDTSLTNDQLRSLATTGLAMEVADVGQLRIPADGTFTAGMHDGVWMIRPNFEKNAALLTEFIYGEAE